jgi:hypothetical protein
VCSEEENDRQHVLLQHEMIMAIADDHFGVLELPKITKLPAPELLRDRSRRRGSLTSTSQF